MCVLILFSLPRLLSVSLAFLLRRQEDDRLVMLGFVADVDFPNSPTNKMPLHIVVKDGANVVEPPRGPHCLHCEGHDPFGDP